MNCDLPSVVRKLEDPEAFLMSVNNESLLVFDEIHRLEDPSRLLKIAADEYAHIRILATGSSTLEATKKFKDSLTGRKTIIHLLPVLWSECIKEFNISDLDLRLFRGGLPEILIANKTEFSFYSEWIDSFFARDIQELFNVRNRSGFLKLVQLLLRSSGGLIEITRLSKMSGLTRPTVMSYLEAMRISNMLYMLSPYHGSGRREITHQPKCYCFDTGFVAFVNGWNEIRDYDRGLLWEHLVLDTLRTHLPNQQVYYWRDKSNREIDFVLKKQGNSVDTVECKINPDHLSVSHIKTFRESYPKGENYCYSPFIDETYSLNLDGIKVNFIGSAEAIV
jgi:predicted AAA+ superfamily ATPase